MLEVLCVDPHPLVAAGLEAVVSGDPAVTLVGSASDSAAAVAAAREAGRS